MPSQTSLSQSSTNQSSLACQTCEPPIRKTIKKKIKKKGPLDDAITPVPLTVFTVLVRLPVLDQPRNDVAASVLRRNALSASSKTLGWSPIVRTRHSMASSKKCGRSVQRPMQATKDVKIAHSRKIKGTLSTTTAGFIHPTLLVAASDAYRNLSFLNDSCFDMSITSPS